MKVRLLDKVGKFQYEGKVYHAGDTLEIIDSVFVPYLMTEVKSARPQPVKMTPPTKPVEPLFKADVPAVKEPTPAPAEKKTSKEKPVE